MLELAVMNWPSEDGSFPHVSGVKFFVNTAIPSSVQIDENGEFTGVSGKYRVYDIRILNKETSKYEPIDLNKQYSFASHNYYILEYGGGMAMLKGAKILQNDGMLDVELLEKYIVENLGGVIGQNIEKCRLISLLQTERLLINRKLMMKEIQESILRKQEMLIIFRGELCSCL